MRKLSLLATITLLSAAVLPASAEAGCYRMGETGYHWYRSCFGPHWFYPHHRSCRRGFCWYH